MMLVPKRSRGPYLVACFFIGVAMAACAGRSLAFGGEHGEGDQSEVVPDREAEADYWQGRQGEDTPLDVLLFYAERFQRNLHYGKNEFPDCYTSTPRYILLDHLKPRERGPEAKIRYFMNGTDAGAGNVGVDRLLEVIEAAPKGTRIGIIGYPGSENSLDELLPSPRVVNALYEGFGKGRLEPSFPTYDPRLCIGKVVWPGHVRRLPDIVLTWTTPEHDAHSLSWAISLHEIAHYFVNGVDMGVGKRGFANVLAKLKTFPEKSRLLIYPFYAPRFGMASAFAGPCAKRTQRNVPYASPSHFKRLQEVLLSRHMELILLATPTRKLQQEADRWLLAGGGPWRLKEIAPLGIDLGTFFYLRRPHQDLLWIPDAYPPVTPLIPRASSIPTPPNWIHYKPERSKLRVFYPKQLVFDAMRPCYGLTGVEGIESMTIELGDGPPEKHTVYLYFAEPNKEARPNERIFSVSLQGREVLTDLDIVGEVGNPFRPVIKEFRDISTTNKLEITFQAKKGDPVLCAVKIVPGDPPPKKPGPHDYRRYDPKLRDLGRSYSPTRR